MSELSALAGSEGYEVRDDEGLGRLPNKHFRGASGSVKIASVSTLALLASSAPPMKWQYFRGFALWPHSVHFAR